jgi:ribonuclease HI
MKNSSKFNQAIHNNSHLCNMAKKQKYYVVWEGVKPGIYTTWDDAKAQVMGYPTAKYKSFESKAEAEEAFKNSYLKYYDFSKKNEKDKPQNAGNQKIIQESIAVDAACSGNPGDMEYRGVYTRTKQQIFHQGPFKEGTNNIGEFLALVHALAFLKREEKHTTPIYSDSRTAIAWVRNKKVKTELKETPRNEKIFELIDRALAWLQNNTYQNPIIKWETQDWGEIPADFGRK